MNGLSFIGFSSKHIVPMNDFQIKLKSGTAVTETRSGITPLRGSIFEQRELARLGKYRGTSRLLFQEIADLARLIAARALLPII